MRASHTMYVSVISRCILHTYSIIKAIKSMACQYVRHPVELNFALLFRYMDGAVKCPPLYCSTAQPTSLLWHGIIVLPGAVTLPFAGYMYTRRSSTAHARHLASCAAAAAFSRILYMLWAVLRTLLLRQK
jgi:hypothetical protein